MANPWERDWSQSGEGIYIPPNPTKQRGVSAEVGSKESEARVDRATEQDQIRKAAAEASKAEADARNAALQGQLTALEADLKNATGGLTTSDFNERKIKLGQYAALIEQINRVQGLLNEGPNRTSGLRGLRDYLPSDEGAAIDAASAALAQQAFSTFRVPGAGPQSDADQRLFVEANQPSRMSFDSANSERLRSLKNRIEKDLSSLGQPAPQWTAEIVGAKSDGQEPGNLPQANLSRQAPQAQTALQGKGKGGVIMDPALAGFGKQIRDAFVNGASADQLIAMEAAKMAELGRPIGAGRIQFYRDLEKTKQQNPNVPLGGIPVNWSGIETTEASPDESVIGNLQSGLGNFAASDTGQFVTSAANAATLGVPAMMAGDNATAALDQMREESPFLSFGGDLVGSGAALAGLGLLAPVKGLGLLGRGNGFGADMFYSTARGAVEGGPAGAVIGAVSGVAGDAAGRSIGQVARRAGAAGGPERPDTYLRLIGGEIDDVSRVGDALRSGREINMPVSIADVESKLRPMAGAAFRRSDWDTQDAITKALVDRHRSQSPRMTEQIERNFGPIQDPDEVAGELIKTAQARSQPFYDEAMAQPPAYSDEISSLLATPFGRQGVAHAAKMSGNARVPLRENGFSYDASGNAVLNPIPIDAIGSTMAAREAALAADARLADALGLQGASLNPTSMTDNVALAQSEAAAARQALADAEAGLAAAPVAGAQAEALGYTPQSINYVKFGMDEALEPYRNPITRKLELTPAGRLEDQVRKDLLSEYDRINPAYGVARAEYAGPASIRDGLGIGADAFTMDNRKLQRALDARSAQPSVPTSMGQMEAIDAMKIGAIDNLNQQNIRRRAGANPYLPTDDHLFDVNAATLFGQDAASSFANARKIEQDMQSTMLGAIGNSATAGRLIADEKLSGDILGELAAHGAIDMTTGGAPIATSLGLANRFLKDRAGLGFAGAREGVSSDLSRFLLDTTTQPDEITRLLQQAVDYEKFAQDVRRKAAMGGSALTTSGASSLGIY